MSIDPSRLNEHKLSENISTHIREGINGWQAGFSIQHQTFYLQPVSCDKGDDEDTEWKAKWYQNNLDTALNRILKNNSIQTVEQQIETIKRITKDICETPEKARKFLEDAGIIEYDYKGRLSDTENLMQMSGREGEVTTAVTNKLTVDEIKTFLAEYFDDEPDEEQIKLLQAFQTINENKL